MVKSKLLPPVWSYDKSGMGFKYNRQILFTLCPLVFLPSLSSVDPLVLVDCDNGIIWLL